MQFTTIFTSAVAITVAAALPQQSYSEKTPPVYPTGDNSTATTPVYPASNGTSTSGHMPPSGTGSAYPSSSAGFVPSTGGAEKSFASSAALGLVLVGGVALAL